MGRLLLGAGLLLAVAGLVMIGLERAGLSLGRMPGDVSYRGRGFSFVAPIGTSLLLSMLVSLLLWLIASLRK